MPSHPERPRDPHQLAKSIIDIARGGAGKTILKFEKNQHVFEQGDVADTVLHSKRQRQAHCPIRAR